jgi:DNA invertase Pin-like site-specific DNA recombinase
MAKKLRNEPRVFSYQRFSRPEQAKGDSFRRQQATSFDLAKQIAKERRMPFDESLSAGDRGLSAFTGAHRKKGVLGTFLAAIQAGEVPPGSILVVEDIDRLSRLEPIDAIDMIIIGIIGKGISIVASNQEYDQKSLRGGLIHVLIGKLMGAHEDSEKKSKRLSAAWAQKRVLARETGKPLTRLKPAWLELVDGKYKIIPEAAKVIRTLFQLKLKGHGVRSIESQLNTAGVWHAPASAKRKTSGWRHSYINKVLRERSVLGEYQPHRKVKGKRIKDGEPIEGYFPAIVKPEVFHAVQQQLAKNKGTGGANGKICNLFTNLVKCGYCGGPMHFLNKGTAGVDWRYLTCDNGRRAISCERRNMRYTEVETLLLDNCPKLKPEQVLPKANDRAELVEELSLRVEGLSARLSDFERKIENLVDQLADTSDKTLRGRYQTRVLELESNKAASQLELNTAEAELRSASVDTRSFREWKQGLDDLKVALRDGGADVRLAARQHFRQFIESIECFTSGQIGLWDKESRAGDDIVEYAESAVENIRMPKTMRAEFREFVADLAQRRMTKEGRYIRVHFTTGAVVDLVPARSLASGMTYGNGVESKDQKTWRFLVPDLQQLFDEFRKRNSSDKKI